MLARAIELSGMSARQFARDVLWRDERTVRRWLAGDSPVPAVVSERLREFVAARDFTPDVGGWLTVEQWRALPGVRVRHSESEPPPRPHVRPMWRFVTGRAVGACRVEETWEERIDATTAGHPVVMLLTGRTVWW